MQQTSEKTRGKVAHSSHMSKRPPRLSQLTGTPDQPHMHAEQHADEEITDWVSLEGGQTDPLMVPEQVKRPGWIVNWKVCSVLGSQDSAIKRRMTDYHRAGWRPVPGERGRGFFFLPGEAVPPTIEIGGQILMERPEYIEKEARRLNAHAARQQLTNKLEEVGLMSPENVRRKLIKHEVTGGDGIQTVPGSEAAVPDA